MAYKPAYIWNGTGWDQIGNQAVSNLDDYALLDPSASANQTITNTILTSPDINGGTVDDATITGGSITNANITDNVGDVAVFGDGVVKIVALTQAEYDALTPETNVLYVITG